MIVLVSIFLSFLLYLLGESGPTALTIGIIFLLLSRLLFQSTKTFAFREFTLLLYALNYLVSPLITYNLDQDLVSYPMKIPQDEYFVLAIPGFLLFTFGVYSIKTSCFNIDMKNVKELSVVNERFLKIIFVFGLLSRIATIFIEGELNFILYLFGLIRFVSAFSLFSIRPKKYFLWPVIVLLFELTIGLIAGAYHDAIMWIIFFGLFYVYTIRPNTRQIIFLGSVGVSMVLGLQAIKFSYREKVWQGDKSASIESVVDIGSENIKTDILFGEENLLSTLNRGNQAWIFASTVDNLNKNKDFQGLNNVNKYIEAALLPRFLAPNKIKSGDQEIFNEFSGHTLGEGTAMGLGIFADGYIAYGAWGVYIFGFVLGLIFSLTFKIVERWTKVSPFYVLMLLPLLNYAVRPDCELQTTINHLFKGILLYGFLVYLTRKRFTLDSKENQRKLIHLNLAKGNGSR